MSIGHIGLSGNTQLSQDLKRDTQLLQDVVDRLVKHRDAMVQMQDGGVSGAYIVARYGFVSGGNAAADAAVADAAIAELSSVVGKLTTDGSVSSVAAAIKQLGDKFR